MYVFDRFCIFYSYELLAKKILYVLSVLCICFFHTLWTAWYIKKYYNESLGFPAPEVQKWNFQKWLYTESLGFSTEVQKWNFQKWLYTESLGFSTEVQKW
jgi:hypothetical protein